MMIYQGQAVVNEKTGINVKNGWGRGLFCNASYYEGNWVQDKREGFGVEIKPSGKISNLFSREIKGGNPAPSHGQPQQENYYFYAQTSTPPHFHTLILS